MLTVNHNIKSCEVFQCDKYYNFKTRIKKKKTK